MKRKKKNKRNKFSNNQPVSAVYMEIRWNLNKYLFFKEVIFRFPSKERQMSGTHSWLL